MAETSNQDYSSPPNIADIDIKSVNVRPFTLPEGDEEVNDVQSNQASCHTAKTRNQKGPKTRKNQKSDAKKQQKKKDAPIIPSKGISTRNAAKKINKENAKKVIVAKESDKKAPIIVPKNKMSK